MNKDTITGILGALVLVAAMTGVFFYERGQFDEYGIVWEQQIGEAAQAGETLDHAQTGDPQRFDLNLTQAIVARVVVEVTWTENTGDEFRLVVTAPNGTTYQHQGTRGTLVVEVPVQSVPASTIFADRDPDGARIQARAALGEEATNAGQGRWTTQVTLVDAMRPDDTLPPDVSPPAEGSNEYDLRFTPLLWAPTVDAT